MPKYIKNQKDLNKAMRDVAINTLKSTQNLVYKTIQESIEEYYAEYSPDIYKRTYRFFKSLIKTDVIKKADGYYCIVKIDEDYLNYAYPYTGKFNPSYPHDIDGRFAMGRDVVNWANRKFPDDEGSGGNHGYTIDTDGDGFWDRSMEELGDIMALLKSNLNKQGVHVV